MTFQVTQAQIDEGPTQDAFLGPVNAAIREALKLHEGDMVLVRRGAITVQRRGRHPQYWITPDDVKLFCDLYDSEGNRGKQLVSPFSFDLDVA